MQFNESTNTITTYRYGIPIEGDTGELTVGDTLQMLNELGVDTDDQ